MHMYMHCAGAGRVGFASMLCLVLIVLQLWDSKFPTATSWSCNISHSDPSAVRMRATCWPTVHTASVSPAFSKKLLVHT